MPAFDPRGANEAGFPWEKDYARINPAYFDMADLRFQHLVSRGLAPCIVGCWGYFLQWMGVARMKRHWRNLVGWGLGTVRENADARMLRPMRRSTSSLESM